MHPSVLFKGPSVPPIVTSTVVPTLGSAMGSDVLLSIVAATMATAVSMLLLAGLAALLCAAVMRRRQMKKADMGKSISIGEF